MIDNRLKFLFLVIFLVLLSLACSVSGATQPSNANNQAAQLPLASEPPEQLPDANSPAGQQAQTPGFLEADCNVSGVTFDKPNIGKSVDDIYDGPNLVCNYSGEGPHGLSETVYFRIVAYKADKLEQFYQDMQTNIQGFVDQATEWNAQPDIPESAKDTITFLRNDSDGYVFLITSEANVQDCTNGDGYGVEKINGKYLVQLTFTSCEGDAGSYLETIQNLQDAAAEAILRVEESAQP